MSARIETLQQVVREKLVLLKELEHSVQARDRLQKAAGLPAGNEIAGRLVEGLQQALTQDWTALGPKSRNASPNSMTAMVDWRSRASATHATLGILTGRTATATPAILRRRGGGGELYTRQGLTCGQHCRLYHHHPPLQGRWLGLNPRPIDLCASVSRF